MSAWRALAFTCALLAMVNGALAQDFALPMPKPSHHTVSPVTEPLAIPRPAAKPTSETEVPPPHRAEATSAQAAAPQGPKDGPGCRAALRALGGLFEAAPPIRDGACGAPTPITLSAVGRITLTPEATVRCGAALAFATWLTSAVRGAAKAHLPAPVSSVRIAASYHCRGRRGGGGGGRLSEHALANAIDVSAFTLRDGTMVDVTERRGASRERRFQRAVREAACRTFTTVIGPGTNAAHADHFHFDLAQRRGGYRLCE